MPKVGTADYRKIIKLMKESASRLKIEWLYVNKILAAICAFVVVIFISFQMHRIAKEYVYEQPTSDYNILGGKRRYQRQSDPAGQRRSGGAGAD